MLDRVAAAALEHVQEAGEVRGEVGARVHERVADARLRGEVDDGAEALAREDPLARRGVGEVAALEAEPGAAAQERDARLLEPQVVVAVQGVHGADGDAGVEEPSRDVVADEPGRPGDEHGAGVEGGGGARRSHRGLSGSARAEAGGETMNSARDGATARRWGRPAASSARSSSPAAPARETRTCGPAEGRRSAATAASSPSSAQGSPPARETRRMARPEVELEAVERVRSVGADLGAGAGLAAGDRVEPAHVRRRGRQGEGGDALQRHDDERRRGRRSTARGAPPSRPGRARARASARSRARWARRAGARRAAGGSTRARRPRAGSASHRRSRLAVVAAPHPRPQAARRGEPRRPRDPRAEREPRRPARGRGPGGTGRRASTTAGSA